MSKPDNTATHYSLHCSDGSVITPAAGKTVTIGQGDVADIRLSSDGPYADIPVIAKIVETEDGSPCIVRVSKFIPLRLSGREVHYLHHLSDKDSIEVGDLEPRISFRVEPGAQPPQTLVRRGLSRRGLAVAIIALALLFGSALWWVMRMSSRDQLSDEMLSAAQASLYRIQVDSLFLFEGDSLVETYAYPTPPAGTAFLTTDSLLVTARHCIEPWLNAVSVADIPDLASNENPAVRLAARAETHNQLAAEDEAQMSLLSGITLTDSRGREFRVRSSAFAVNRSRDEIIELGPYDTDLFWRNIQARYGRSDMMLGDAVACRMSRPGAIELADSALLASELRPRSALNFLGFPVTQGRDETAELETDVLRQPLARSVDDPSAFFMLAHGGRLSPGYSGGPVLMLSPSGARGFVAVGLVSVLDHTNGHRSYSVPSTEIPRL